MKVLHLISSCGLFGAERVILTLASQNNGIDFWVGALNNHHNPHLEIIQEAKTAGLKTIVFDSRGQVDFKTVSSIQKFLNENSIDILHTHNYKSDIMGFWATRFSYTQWVATNHVWHSTDSKMRFYETIDAIVLKFAKMIFTVSQEIKDDMLQKGFKENHIHVIHNGINISQFNPKTARVQLRADWKVSDNEILLTIVGRLAPEKGHEVLFKAMTQITKQHPNVKLLVIGDGPLRNNLEEQIKNLNLSNHIILAGLREDMPDVYRSCDILVNASYKEGLPMTILEAMASGLTIIATRVGAVPQVIREGENGILLEAGNSEVLAQAVISLLNDPSQRQILAQQAYKDVCRDFSDQIMFDKYKQLYEAVLTDK